MGLHYSGVCTTHGEKDRGSGRLIGFFSSHTLVVD